MGVDRVGWPGDRTWIEVDVGYGLGGGTSVRRMTPSPPGLMLKLLSRVRILAFWAQVTPEKAQSTPQQRFLSFYSIDPWAFLRRTAFECFLESMGGVPYH